MKPGDILICITEEHNLFYYTSQPVVLHDKYEVTVTPERLSKNIGGGLDLVLRHLGSGRTNVFFSGDFITEKEWHDRKFVDKVDRLLDDDK